MKKHLSKVTAIVSGVFGLVFIILLLVTAFGGLDASDFDNRLVKVLLFVFGGCYLATTIATVLFEFADRMPVREIQVSQSGKGGVRVTPAVIRKLVRKPLRELDEATCAQMMALIAMTEPCLESTDALPARNRANVVTSVRNVPPSASRTARSASRVSLSSQKIRLRLPVPSLSAAQALSAASASLSVGAPMMSAIFPCLPPGPSNGAGDRFAIVLPYYIIFFRPFEIFRKKIPVCFLQTAKNNCFHCFHLVA